MKSVNLHYNDSCGDEGCPNCGAEFTSMFMESVCDECGFISFGCSICPRSSAGTCYGRDCAWIHNQLRHPLFAILNKKFNVAKIPADYLYQVDSKAGEVFVILEGIRLVPIFSRKSVKWLTTIDMSKWREIQIRYETDVAYTEKDMNADIEKLLNETPKFSTLFNEED